MRTIVSLTFSPDNQLLLAGNGWGKIHLYRLPGLELAAASWSNHNTPWGMAFATKSRIFVRCDGPVLGVQDYAAQYLREYVGHETQPNSVCFNHRGDWLVSGAEDGEMLLWSIPGSSVRLVAEAPSYIGYFGGLPLPPSSPGGSKVAVLSNGGVHVLDAGARRTIAPICPPAFPLAFEGENSLLVIRGLSSLEADRMAPPPEKIQRPCLEWWDLLTGTHVAKEILGLDGKEITVVAVSPDRTMLALSWSEEGNTHGLSFVDSHSGALRRNMDQFPYRINALEFSPDGRSLAMTTYGGRVELMAYPSGEVVKTLTTGNGSPIQRVIFSPDGKQLAVAEAYGIRLWRLADGRDIGYFGGYNRWVDYLQFSADGKTLVGWCAVDNKFWHMPTRREMLQLPQWDKKSVPWIPMTGEKFVMFRNRSSYWEVVPLPPLDHAEDWLNAQPESLTEARRMLFAITPRDPGTPPGLVDLDRYYCGGLDQLWQGDQMGNDLSSLPHGVHQLKSTLFDIRGIVLPGNGSSPRTIQVGQTCQRLRFLHNATGRGVELKPGMLIGRYLIHYADGQQAEVPLVTGRTIQAWWDDPANLESSAGAEVAWVGTNARSRKSNRAIHLLNLTWTNPRPEVPIETLDFEQTGQMADPFLVAVTAE